MSCAIKKLHYDAVNKYLIQAGVARDLNALGDLKYVTTDVITGISDLMDLADVLGKSAFKADKLPEIANNQGTKLKEIRDRLRRVEIIKSKRTDTIYALDKESHAYHQELIAQFKLIGDILDRPTDQVSS